MKKSLAAVLAAVLVLGSTTTFFAAGSIAAGDLTNNKGNIANITAEEAKEVAEKTALKADAVSAGSAKITVDNSVIKAETVQKAAADAVKLVKEKFGVDVTAKDSKVSAAIVAVVNLSIDGHVDGTPVDVTFKVEGVKAGETIMVLHEKADKTWEAVPVKEVKNGEVVATCSNFSNYSIVKVAAQAEQTGLVTVLPLAATICAAGAVVCGKKVKFNA